MGPDTSNDVLEHDTVARAVAIMRRGKGTVGLACPTPTHPVNLASVIAL